MDVSIFDAHLHVGPWSGITVNGTEINPFKNRTFDSTESLSALMDKRGIVRAVIVPIYSPIQEDAFLLNKLVIQIASEIPERVVPGFWVDPSPCVSVLLEDTLRLADASGVTVLKTSPETWASDYSPDPETWDSSFRTCMDSILDYAKSEKAILQIHTGSGKSNIRFVEKLIHYAGKEVAWHLVHLGNTVSGHFYVGSKLSHWLHDGYQISADTSHAGGFAVRWFCDLATQDTMLGQSIMFASDEPWGSFQAELAKVIDGTSTQMELREAVLWSNACRAYSGRGRR